MIMKIDDFKVGDKVILNVKHPTLAYFAGVTQNNYILCYPYGKTSKETHPTANLIEWKDLVEIC